MQQELAPLYQTVTVPVRETPVGYAAFPSAEATYQTGRHHERRLMIVSKDEPTWQPLPPGKWVQAWVWMDNVNVTDVNVVKTEK